MYAHMARALERSRPGLRDWEKAGEKPLGQRQLGRAKAEGTLPLGRQRALYS